MSNLSELIQPGHALDSFPIRSLGTMSHHLLFLHTLSVTAQLVGSFHSALELINSQRKCSRKRMPLKEGRKE